MKYTREKLIAQIDEGNDFEYLLFYGQKASADGSVIGRILIFISENYERAR